MGHEEEEEAALIRARRFLGFLCWVFFDEASLAFFFFFFFLVFFAIGAGVSVSREVVGVDEVDPVNCGTVEDRVGATLCRPWP